MNSNGWQKKVSELWQDDYRTYQRFKQEEELEHFQRHFIEWFESDGRVHQERYKWNYRLRKMTERFGHRYVSSNQSKVKASTIQTIASSYNYLSEEMAEKIVREFCKRTGYDYW